jgi:hypothetical protein
MQMGMTLPDDNLELKARTLVGWRVSWLPVSISLFQYIKQFKAISLSQVLTCDTFLVLFLH